ncbi:hypothetical protein PHET_04985 [Paragonimus heterotremus]|uniref:Protein sleepless n=1 Tax=Paragonimus heterotremus TaxID=100268 RepID=A0A8J4WRK7_9TREM|nr:hypothetical protein PHET_04985 [Paragonimus heterotremus]
MLAFNSIFLIASLSLLTAHVSLALECYQCNSFNDKGCFPFNSALVRPKACPPESTWCNKVFQRAPFQPDPKTNQTTDVRVLRLCSQIGPDELGGNCIERIGTNKVNIRHCSCADNACNQAVSVQWASKTLLITLPLLTWTLL